MDLFTLHDQYYLLPETQRSIIILADIMEFSHQEIAGILKLPVENLKVKLHRARKKFKTILEKECTFEVDERSVLVCEPLPRKKAINFLQSIRCNLSSCFSVLQNKRHFFWFMKRCKISLPSSYSFILRKRALETHGPPIFERE
jgi:hypothetical protein